MANVNGGVFVRSTPAASGTLLGSQNLGATGAIISGPVIDAAGDGLARWNVNFDTGADGWSIEKGLAKTAIPPPVLHSALWWTQSTSVVSGYNMYRSTVKGGPYTKINTSLIISAATQSAPYIDASAVSKTTYYYVATAVNSSGAESTYSNEVQLTAP